MEKRQGILTTYLTGHLHQTEFVLYDGQNQEIYYFQNGDTLAIFDKESEPLSIVIEKISLKYGEASRYGNLSWHPKGLSPDEWKELCEKHLRAEVVIK